MKGLSLTRWLLLAALAFASLAGCTSLDEQQRKWIFQPTDRTWWGGAQGVEAMSDVWIEFASAEEKSLVTSGSQIAIHRHELLRVHHRNDLPSGIGAGDAGTNRLENGLRRRPVDDFPAASSH